MPAKLVAAVPRYPAACRQQLEEGGSREALRLHPAPNPRRVRIFLAEKGITVPMVQLDLFKGTHLTPEALKRNPYCGRPVLELDDGTCIAESVAIWSVFRGALSRPVADGGRTPSTRAVVAMWNRRMSRIARRDLAAPQFELADPRDQCPPVIPRPVTQPTRRPLALLGAQRFAHLGCPAAPPAPAPAETPRPSPEER